MPRSQNSREQRPKRRTQRAELRLFGDGHPELRDPPGVVKPRDWLSLQDRAHQRTFGGKIPCLNNRAKLRNELGWEIKDQLFSRAHDCLRVCNIECAGRDDDP